MQRALRHLEILDHFLTDPYREIHLRELSRKTGVSAYTVKEALDDMVAEKLVTETRTGNLRLFKANTEDNVYRLVKKAFSVRKLRDSGLVEYLIGAAPAASSVTLYGSVAKGLDSPESDIDILVVGQKPEKIDLAVFEDGLKRRIEVTFIRWSDWVEASRVNKAFYTEVVTSGISLFGELPVVD